MVIMKIKKIVFALCLVSFTFLSCKTEGKKDATKVENETKIAKAEMVSLNLSGMSCEMGCAKVIESKLAKKEGVLNAQVIFADSIATVKYDANKVNKADLISFVESIGDGTTYKASETAKKACEADCKKECDSADKTKKQACVTNCEKKCCDDEKA